LVGRLFLLKKAGYYGDFETGAILMLKDLRPKRSE